MIEYLKSARDKLEHFICFSLLFFLPTQLGRHFWPSFTFVTGLRVDYLSPTIYFTDILIICLFVCWVSHGGILQKVCHLKSLKVLLLIMLLVCINASFSIRPMLSWYFIYKLLEYIFLCGVIGKFFLLYKKQCLYVLLSAVIGESILAIAQFIHQGSIGGILYFIGERSFTGVTPGIANTSIAGHLILRPYATFSHPNVLAGFLLLMLTILLFSYDEMRNTIEKLLLIGSMSVGGIALCITLSRVAILLGVVVYITCGFYYFSTKLAKKKLFISTFVILGMSILGISFFFPILYYRFSGISLSDESLTQRIELARSAWLMFISHPYQGVGLGNFLVALPRYTYSYQNVYSIQPVHNIFLLLAAELGVSGLLLSIGFSIWLFTKLYKDYIRRKKGTIMLFAVVMEVIILGMFDHYFLTLQQGQLVLTFIISLIIFANQSSPA